MNIHYDPMKCTGCAQEFPFPKIARSYTDLPEAGGRQGAGFSEMLLLPVWCHACEGASWVERIPTEREFASAAGLRRRAGRSDCNGIEDDLLDIDDDAFRWLYHHLPHRKTPSRCLVCASTHFTPIDPTQRRTTIVHEACWDSPIEFRGFSIGSSVSLGRRSHAGRFHNREGEFVWIELCVQEFLMGRLNIVLHARRQDPAHATLAAAIEMIVAWASDEALLMLAPLLARDHPAALGVLGALHYVGEGVERSGARAVRLLEQAKTLGDACAAHNLASLYATGAPEVAQDMARARRLFGEARAMGGQYENDAFYDQTDFTAAKHTFYHPL